MRSLALLLKQIKENPSSLCNKSLKKSKRHLGTSNQGFCLRTWANEVGG